MMCKYVNWPISDWRIQMFQSLIEQLAPPANSHITWINLRGAGQSNVPLNLRTKIFQNERSKIIFSLRFFHSGSYIDLRRQAHGESRRAKNCR